MVLRYDDLVILPRGVREENSHKHHPSFGILTLLFNDIFKCLVNAVESPKEQQSSAVIV